MATYARLALSRLLPAEVKKVLWLDSDVLVTGDLERLWYRQKDEQSEFARQLMRLIRTLGDKYQVDELAAKYEFTGRERMTIQKALEVKEELDKLRAEDAKDDEAAQKLLAPQRGQVGQRAQQLRDLERRKIDREAREAREQRRQRESDCNH